MKEPDKIYIYDNAGGNSYSTSPTDNIADKKHEIEYIRKEAILKWAKKEEDKLDSGLCSDGFRLALTMLRQKLNSL